MKLLVTLVTAATTSLLAGDASPQAMAQVRRPVSAVLASPAVLAFRRGLEMRVDGSSWGQTRTVVLPPARCVPATLSPCSAGTPPLIVEIRFPSLPAVIDGSTALAQLGESGPPVNHYFIRAVPANAKGSVCDGGFAVPSPAGVMRLAISVGSPGTPLPVTCRWTALAGVPDPNSPLGFDMVWSDTIAVHITAKQ